MGKHYSIITYRYKTYGNPIEIGRPLMPKPSVLGHCAGASVKWEVAAFIDYSREKRKPGYHQATFDMWIFFF